MHGRKLYFPLSHPPEFQTPATLASRLPALSRPYHLDHTNKTNENEISVHPEPPIYTGGSDQSFLTVMLINAFQRQKSFTSRHPNTDETPFAIAMPGIDSNATSVPT
jgi:hypothetical protein